MWIEQNKYDEIKSLIPIVCVDCVIQYEDAILLVQRATEPARNEWWFVGGRLYLNESLENCAIRKCKEEVGLNVKISRRLHVDNLIFDSIHTPVIVYHCLAESRRVTIDSTINDYMWFYPNNAVSINHFNLYIQECLSLRNSYVSI